MTKLEEEKKRKKQIGELEEEIDVLGQDNEEKAAKWVKEKGKEADKERETEISNTLQFLEEKNRFKIRDYWSALAEIMTTIGKEESFPEGWLHHVVVSDKGIIFYVVSPSKRLFYRAIKPSHEPTYDLVAINKIMESAWERINQIREEEKGYTNGKQIS